MFISRANACRRRHASDSGNVSQKVYVKKSDSKRIKRTEERKRYVVPQKKEERKVVKHWLDKRNYIYYINIEIFFAQLVPI